MPRSICFASTPCDAMVAFPTRRRVVLLLLWMLSAGTSWGQAQLLDFGDNEYKALYLDNVVGGGEWVLTAKDNDELKDDLRMEIFTGLNLCEKVLFSAQAGVLRIHNASDLTAASYIVGVDGEPTVTGADANDINGERLTMYTVSDAKFEIHEPSGQLKLVGFRDLCVKTDGNDDLVYAPCYSTVEYRLQTRHCCYEDNTDCISEYSSSFAVSSLVLTTSLIVTSSLTISSIMSSSQVVSSSPMLSSSQMVSSSPMLSSSEILSSSQVVSSSSMLSSSETLSSSQVVSSSSMLSSSEILSSSQVVSLSPMLSSSEILSSSQVVSSSPMLSSSEILSSSQVVSTTAPTVDGSWSNWTAWTSCTTSCGDDGEKRRSRTCDSPPPSNGGPTCAGDTEETAACTGLPCPNPSLPMKQCWTNINLKGYVIINHVSVVNSVTSVIQCCRWCSEMGDSCQSFTLGQLPSTGGAPRMFSCQMNNITKVESDRDHCFNKKSQAYQHYHVGV